MQTCKTLHVVCELHFLVLQKVLQSAVCKPGQKYFKFRVPYSYVCQLTDKVINKNEVQ